MLNRQQNYACVAIGGGLQDVAEIGGPAFSAEAFRFLFVVGMIESEFRSRYQFTRTGKPGPARGFWQFERAGVNGVMTHGRTKKLLAALCELHFIEWREDAIWRALEGHDRFAAGVARLLLWSDPFAIPADVDSAWTCYAKRTWRPGKPNPGKFAAAWRFAVDQL